jgi:hypothetical protein
MVNGPAQQDVTVFYVHSGAAIFGIDYTMSGTAGQIVIPAGQSFGQVTLHALENSDRTKRRNAIMTLTAGSGYSLVGEAKFRKAKVQIRKY